uniref:Uncharacterized protein LOC111109317 n=1 Tax=Crassostrea virginica TaxID=6565 RepID=A0A8B8BDN7_CRAVI|nr:uncharacterized protein LOC111109317 [Crassostrea virginica]
MPFNSGLVVYVGFIYTLLMAVVSSNVSKGEMCLEQALTIHAVLKQDKECPYNLLGAVTASKQCSVLCKGRFTSNNKLYDERHCVGFNIRFNLDNEYSTQLIGFPCNISRCILETIKFECFNENLRNGDQGNSTGCEGAALGEKNMEFPR